jgi:SAM-dependent methyltransferase
MSDEFTEAAAQQGELWSAAGQNWAERFAPLLAPVWAASHDLARVTAGTRLLDVGCGSGGALRVARLRGADVAGLDAAPDLLEIAKDRLPHSEFRCGDMENLPYEDDSFDAVTHINSIMYADDPARAIREASRVLTPDGRLAMAVWSDPEICEFRHVMKALRGVLPAPPPGDGPFALSGPRALEAAMKAEGFEPVETRDVPIPFVFVDQTHYLRAIHGTGPGQGVRRQVGEEAMTEALLEVGAQFVQDDGAYHLENTFRVVAATLSDD